VKRAWLEAKRVYLAYKGATYPDDFANYADNVSKRKALERLVADKLAGKDV
jgi:hypothetical protein